MGIHWFVSFGWGDGHQKWKVRFIFEIIKIFRLKIQECETPEIFTFHAILLLIYREFVIFIKISNFFQSANDVRLASEASAHGNRPVLFVGLAERLQQEHGYVARADCLLWKMPCRDLSGTYFSLELFLVWKFSKSLGSFQRSWIRNVSFFFYYTITNPSLKCDLYRRLIYSSKTNFVKIVEVS